MVALRAYPCGNQSFTACSFTPSTRRLLDGVAMPVPHPTHWLISTQAPTGYRVSKGTGNQDYGEYTKHDYLKRLSDLLAEHGRKSGADLKMLLDPSMKSLMERRNKEGV